MNTIESRYGKRFENRYAANKCYVLRNVAPFNLEEYVIDENGLEVFVRIVDGEEKLRILYSAL